MRDQISPRAFGGGLRQSVPAGQSNKAILSQQGLETQAAPRSAASISGGELVGISPLLRAIYLENP